MSEDLENAINGGSSLEAAVQKVVKETYAQHKRIVFDGDGYSEEWHAEAEQRGLANLRTTPDALPSLLSDTTVTAFSNYAVLTERELESRYEVLLEQYVTKLNIEAETAASMARTRILPSAVRYLLVLRDAELDVLADELKAVIDAFGTSIATLESANASHPETEDVLVGAQYMRDTVIPAMDGCREIADQLEKLVADDLWPLPKYEEMLFIK
jgi:glutamine synthetase